MRDAASLTTKSIEILCGLQEENGGFLATSKADAYPFVYPRDGVFMSIALNLHGLSEKSKRFYRLLSTVRRPNGELLQRYNGGYPSVSQKGEADVTPIAIQGIYDTYVSSGDREFLESSWRLVEEGVGFVLSSVDARVGLVRTTRSIHENRSLEEGYEIWANSASVRGLLDASRVASALGKTDLADKWQGHAAALWGAMLEHLLDRERGLFIKNLRFGGDRLDAPDISQLSPFYFELCPDVSALENSLVYLKRTLWNKEVGGVNRFRDFELVTDWHWYTGGTRASWPLFTLWMARLFRRLGDSVAAEECLDFVRRASTPDMEIPEKVAPVGGYNEWKENETDYNERVINGIALAEARKTSIPGYVPWACPLGWSHAEYLTLDRRDESSGLHKMLGEPALMIRTR